MINIMRAEFYKSSRNIIIWITLLLSLGLCLMGILDAESERVTGSFVATHNGGWTFAVLLYVGIVVAIITGKDFIDKTIYYEIMAGHKRYEIYFGREIVAAVVSTLGSIFITCFWPFVFTMINGWGDLITLRIFLFRIICLVFTGLKVVGVVCMLSFILKNHYASMGVVSGIGFVEYTAYILDLMPDRLKPFFSLSSLYRFTDYSQLMGTKDYYSIISRSALLTCICTMVGYIFLISTDIDR